MRPVRITVLRSLAPKLSAPLDNGLPAFEIALSTQLVTQQLIVRVQETAAGGEEGFVQPVVAQAGGNAALVKAVLRQLPADLYIGPVLADIAEQAQP